MNISRVGVAIGLTGVGATGTAYVMERRSSRHLGNYSMVAPLASGLVATGAGIGVLSDKLEEQSMDGLKKPLSGSARACAKVAGLAGVALLGTLVGSALGARHDGA